MKLFSLAPLTLLLAPIAAQGSVLPYFPKDTIAAVSAPDLATSAAEFAKMPLAKMWAEPDVQKFFADVIQLAKKKIDEGLAEAKKAHAAGQFPIDPEQVLKLRITGVSAAITSLAIAPGDRHPKWKVGALIHLDFGDSAATWKQLILTGLQMMEAEAGKDLTKQESRIGDVTLTSYLPPPEEGIEMGLHIALLPRGVLIGTLADDVRETVAAITGKTPMLGASSLYQATAAHLDTKGAECEAYFRPDPVVTFALDAAGVFLAKRGPKIDMAGLERAVKAMGLRDLGAVGATSSYVDGKCISHSYDAKGAAAATTDATTNATTTTAVTTVKTIDTAFLKWVPKDAVGFSASTLDAMSIYDALERGLNAYDPEFAKKAMAHVAKLEEQLGFNIRNDFFGAIGDHVITWQMPIGTISSAPELAVLIKVNDDKKLVNVFKNLAKLTNGMVEFEEGEKRGVMVYQLKINFDPTQGRGGMNPFDMLTPTFAFKNGYLVFGFSPSDVKRVFARMDRKDDDAKNDIRGNKEFAAVASTIPTGLTSVSFTDWKSNFESLYGVATGVLAFVPMGDQVPIDMSLLPESGSLTKHLFASVSWSKADAKGTESTSVSPFGPEVAVLLAVMVAAAVVVSASMR
jgi:hypothetical protein